MITHIMETVEAEAIPAGVMRDLLRNTILQFAPPTIFDNNRKSDAREHQFLHRVGKRLASLIAAGEWDDLRRGER